MVSTRSPRARGQLRRKSSDKFNKKILRKSESKVTKTKAKKEEPKTPKVLRKVRVWWPPTKNKSRSDVSGMFWPAKVVEEISSSKVNVQYDNEDRETVSVDKLQPYDTPVAFGEEKEPLLVGEFCEVFNNSKSDPAAWFGRVVEIKKNAYMIEYPFCDGPPESKKAVLVRRARIQEAPSKAWCFVDPTMKWKDAKLSSPMEAKLLTASEFKQWQTKPKTTSPKPDKRKAPSSPSKTVKKSPVKSAPVVSPIKKMHKNAPASPSKGQKRKGTSNATPVATPQKKSASDGPDKKKSKIAEIAKPTKYRAELQKKNPKMDITDITKLLGEMWRKVSDEEKKEMTEISSKDKARYEAENNVYLAKLKASQPKVPALQPGMIPPFAVIQNSMPPGKKLKSKKPPKQPKSAYEIYEAEKMKADGKKFSAKDASDAWKALADKEKVKYEKKAEREKKKYEKKVVEYQAHQMQGMPMPHASQIPMPFPGGMMPQALHGFQPMQQANPPMFPPGPLISPTQLMDMELLRKQIKKIASEDAYYMVIDALRPDTPKFAHACHAAHMHIIDTKSPDVKGLLVTLFGMEGFEKLKNKTK